MHLYLLAEWIHFPLLGTILPTIKLKVYTFGGGLMNSATKFRVLMLSVKCFLEGSGLLSCLMYTFWGGIVSLFMGFFKNQFSANLLRGIEYQCRGLPQVFLILSV